MYIRFLRIFNRATGKFMFAVYIPLQSLRYIRYEWYLKKVTVIGSYIVLRYIISFTIYSYRTLVIARCSYCSKHAPTCVAEASTTRVESCTFYRMSQVGGRQTDLLSSSKCLIYYSDPFLLPLSLSVRVGGCMPLLEVTSCRSSPFSERTGAPWPCTGWETPEWPPCGKEVATLLPLKPCGPGNTV